MALTLSNCIETIILQEYYWYKKCCRFFFSFISCLLLHDDAHNTIQLPRAESSVLEKLITSFRHFSIRLTKKVH